MLVKDFKFRIVPKPNEKGEYCNCNNADCPAMKFHFIVGNEAKSRLSEEELQDCEIELWTGLFDKNGKKIFEGDIVKVELFYDYSMTCEVVFELGFGLKLISFASVKYSNDPPKDFWTLEEVKDEGFAIEIIGNTHENKDEF
ncbi:hypothetical protein LS70_001105 [Helicobacter sp. MIT 11-5569]|uniref:YopX family protein n=1 Tax=Helicobacter sp. MIT 11-5569 TaxID=1548151 RepID=UPI00051FEC47|nr:YopX family protein [Helicobacter sp. MIT 11-5569]TLD85178.1 hypothetical protein LS70_001105 [Helicobacter sp. MIT 11-5569]